MSMGVVMPDLTPDQLTELRKTSTSCTVQDLLDALEQRDKEIERLKGLEIDRSLMLLATQAWAVHDEKWEAPCECGECRTSA